MARAGTLQLSSCLGLSRSPRGAPGGGLSFLGRTLSRWPSLAFLPFVNNRQVSHEDVEKLRPSYATGGNVNGAATSGKEPAAPQRLKAELLYDPAFPPPGWMPKNYEQILWRSVTAALRLKQHSSTRQLMDGWINCGRGNRYYLGIKRNEVLISTCATTWMNLENSMQSECAEHTMKTLAGGSTGWSQRLPEIPTASDVQMAHYMADSERN